MCLRKANAIPAYKHWDDSVSLVRAAPAPDPAEPPFFL
jgi:hypothetical protein